MNKESTHSNAIPKKKNKLGTSMEDVCGISIYYFLVQVLIILVIFLILVPSLEILAKAAVIFMSFGLMIVAISFKDKFLRYLHVLCYMFIVILYLMAFTIPL